MDNTANINENDTSNKRFHGPTCMILIEKCLYCIHQPIGENKCDLTIEAKRQCKKDRYYMFHKRSEEVDIYACMKYNEFITEEDFKI